MEKKPSFKPYNQGQITFLPPSLEDLIPGDHIVRVVDSAIDNINTKPLYERYEGVGTSSYNPVMMLKIIVYAYIQGIFTSRGIAKNCRENIMFMWLSGMNMPDYKTIDRFRSERMKDIILDIFSEVSALLHSKGYIQLEENCEKLFETIDEIERQDDRKYGGEDLPELNAGKYIAPPSIRELTDRINEKLVKKPEARSSIWEGLRKLWKGFPGIK
ncbi:MAG TPA: transposase [Clostridia bacterium]|nr:transposase [Clostridia bacterium]